VSASPALVTRLAEELLTATRSATPVEPLSERHPELDLTDAYAIQRELVDSLLGRGGARGGIAGWKVGLTSLAMQRQLGVHQPDYAPIPASLLVEDGGSVRADELIAPRVEAEIAFWLDAPLRGPGVTVAGVLAATGAVSPALEIVDSRVRDWRIRLVDTVADLASCGRIIVGPARVPVKGLDLRLLGVVLDDDGEVAATGAGAACLGDPAAAVAWAANTFGALGVTLEAGQVVMPGAVHASVPMAVGHTYRARFDRLGDVSVSLS